MLTEVSMLKEEVKMLKFKLNAVMLKNQDLLAEIERLRQEINDGWET